VLEDDIAALGEMLAELQHAVGVAGKQLGKRGLAVDQRCAREIDAVEMQEIKQIKAEAVAAALAQVLLQGAEVRRAALGLHHHLAVEKGRYYGQSLERPLHRGEFAGPIEAAAGLQPHAATIDAGEQAIAVELDLVHPGLARGWGGSGRGALRLDEGGQWAGLGAAWSDGVRPPDSISSLFRPRRGRGSDPIAALALDLHIALGHGLDRSACFDRAGPRLEQTVCRSLAGVLVVGLDQQPVLFAALVAALHVHEAPSALELAARELELEVAFGQLSVWVVIGRPAAAVPDDDAASTVFALGDAPLELGIVERVVLDMHREALVVGREARAPGDGPALQDTVELEAQVVMQPARGMLVHDEQLPGLAAQLAARLRGAREVALAVVVAQRRRCHGRAVTPPSSCAPCPCAPRGPFRSASSWPRLRIFRPRHCGAAHP
jgi:hypothetical protein